MAVYDYESRYKDLLAYVHEVNSALSRLDYTVKDDGNDMELSVFDLDGDPTRVVDEAIALIRKLRDER